MKSVSRSASSLTVLVFALCLWQCVQYEVPPKPQPSPFSASLEGNKTTFPAAGGTVNLTIGAGANGWWIVVPDGSKNWLTINKIYGAGDFTVPVIVRPNTTKSPRKVEVVVNSSYQLPPVKLEISQEG